MATNLVVNGVSFPFPNTGDQQWGNNATNWAIAVTNGMLQKSGGTFTLTADVNFGASFGLISQYFKSAATNIAAAGAFRLAKGDTINFRNNANSADLAFGINGSDQPVFNSATIVTTTGTLNNSIVLVTNGSGVITSSSVTTTELGRLSGITSTVVGINDTQTLTNKSLKTDTNRWVDPSDTTKKFAIGASGITTGNTRTMTVPDSDFTAVGTSLTQTLTNKTLTNSQNTFTGFDSNSYLANFSIAASVATNALTIALKDKSGSDPSSTSTAFIGFRNSTATTGTFNTRSVTGALSITVASGTTIGTTNGVQQYIYVYAIDNAGVVELAVSLSGHFDEGAVQTTTAISGGSSATTLYSSTARSGVPVRLIGRISISEATAGTWASSPLEVSNFPFRSTRQVVIGTAQTSNGTTTSATYAAFSANTPTVTFVAQRTTTYKIYGAFVLTNSGAAGNNFLKIQGTAGSPTVLFSQEVEHDEATASYAFTLSPYTLVSLVAGTSYTFTLQAKCAAGTLTLQSSLPTNGHALVAEEYL